MKRAFLIWVRNNKTEETKCKLVKAKSFSAAASDAYFFQTMMEEKTTQDWRIMSINDINFSHDPKKPIT